MATVHHLRAPSPRHRGAGRRHPPSPTAILDRRRRARRTHPPAV